MRHALPVLGQQRVGGQELAHDLTGRQVALEAHGARQAERAGVAAAHLGREAQGDPIVVRHDHRADPTVVLEPEHELSTAVLRRGHSRDVGQRHRPVFGQRAPKILREV